MARTANLACRKIAQRWEVVEAWKRAAIEYGIPETDDHNKGDNDGIAYFQGTITNGRRSSAAQAFLHPVMDRPNLRVITQAHAKQIRVRRQARGRRRVLAGRYAELCGGQRRSDSVRRRDRLAATAGTVRHRPRRTLLGEARHRGASTNRPASARTCRTIGRFAQTFKVKNTITMNQWVPNPLRRYSMGAYYLLTKRGPMGTQPPQLCAFTRSDPSQDTPNLQYHVSAATSDRFGGPLHSHARLLVRHRRRAAAEHRLLPHQERRPACASGDPAQFPARRRKRSASPSTPSA